MSDTPKRSLDGENVSHLAEVRRPTTSAVAQSQASEKLHRACFAGLCGIGALSLMGCSSLASEVHDFQEGWRTADVLEIGSAHSIRRGVARTAGRPPIRLRYQQHVSHGSPTALRARGMRM